MAALGLAALAFGAYSFAERTTGQAMSLLFVGLVLVGAAWLLADGPSVRIPTPARLDELAGRAESVAIEKAGD